MDYSGRIFSALRVCDDCLWAAVVLMPQFGWLLVEGLDAAFFGAEDH